MSNIELQEEEAEVLRSIYDGDDCFKEVDASTFQYKIGEDGSMKSFLLEVVWGDAYPAQVPNVNVDAFYNKHIIDSVKESLLEKLNEQAEMLLDSAMTYTLFEYAKENAETLMADQPDTPTQAAQSHGDDGGENTQQQALSKVKVKKEQLSKAQKRKLYNRLDNKGERPRGWDWVDVVKHLSQTGGGKTGTNS